MLTDLFTFLWESITNLVTLLSGVVAVVIDVIRRYLGWEVSNYWYVRIAVVCLMLGMFGAWREEHHKAREPKVGALAIAAVAKDGAVSSAKNFGAYGLFVEKIDFKGYPAYKLTFQKEPDYFKVETQESATVQVVRIGPNAHRVRCIAAGFGNPAIECNFVVVVYM